MVDPSLLLSVESSGHGRSLLQSSGTVLGVGVGVFVLGFFLVVAVVACVLGSRSTRPGLVYAASAISYGILAVVLIVSPKGAKPPPAPQGYDQSFIPLSIMMALVCLGVLVSLVGLLTFQVRATIYARPLNYHTDILRQR